jgi:hypothetical protein
MRMLERQKATLGTWPKALWHVLYRPHEGNAEHRQSVAGRPQQNGLCLHHPESLPNDSLDTELYGSLGRQTASRGMPGDTGVAGYQSRMSQLFKPCPTTHTICTRAVHTILRPLSAGHTFRFEFELRHMRPMTIQSMGIINGNGNKETNN